MQARRRKAINKLFAIHGRRAVNSVLRHNSRVSDNALVAMSNMWWERAGYILAKLAQGTSISAADVGSRHIYDTCRWGEVVSRLVRARGNALGTAARLARQGKRIVKSDEQSQLLIEQAVEIHAATHRLIRLLARIPPKEVNMTAKPVRSSDQTLFPAAQPVTFGRVKGQLAQARSFIAKCNRDLPAIFAKTGLRPTPADCARIKIEAAKTALGAELIVQICQGGLLGAVMRRDRSGRDRLGVGKRYATWLDPLVDLVPALARFCDPEVGHSG